MAKQMNSAGVRSFMAGFGLVLLFGSVTFGGGIEVPMQSSRAAGEADAFTAQANDPSAIFYNPAGLTQLEGTQISAGAYYLQPLFVFHGDSGASQQMNLPTVLPHVYAESDFGLENWRFGIGANDVFGINEDWGDNAPLENLVNKAQLTVINLAPTIAYKVNSHLSLGTAINIYYGSLDLQRDVLLAAPPVPEGQFKLTGSAFSAGVTPSLMYKIDDRNQIGAYYRSPFTLNFSGKSQITSSVIPEIGPSSSKAPLDFPQSAGIGYSTRLIDPLTLEADVIWTDWHSVDQLLINSINPAFDGQNIPAHWESGFTYRLGAEYQVTKHWFLRAGYAYGQNAVPESTFSPLVPDSNYHLGSVGIGYAADHWKVDLAYDYIFREQRHIESDVNSPTTNGTWNNQINGLMATVTLMF
jgi:long-chain fatty acid transport protein